MRLFDRKLGKDYFEGIPPAPGVYRFLGKDGEVIYVGKAKSLRRRLSQYRNARRVKAHWKMREILKQAQSLEWELCPNEAQALLRELELIQTLQPRYNLASTFFSYYPYMGWKRLPGTQVDVFVLTRKPELFSDYSLHGAFRSSGSCESAFRGLEFLLRRVAHPLPRSKTWGPSAGGRDRKALCFAVQGLPMGWLQQLDRFFRGEGREAMEELVLTLLDQGTSRYSSRDEIEEAFLSLRRFWRHEVKPLAKALTVVRRAGGTVAYPVMQRERDALFIRMRTQSEATLPNPDLSR